MQYKFSERALHGEPSLIREIDAYSFNNPAFISLADGNPAYESYPVEALRELNDLVYSQNSKEALLYGPFGGLPELQAQVAERLEKVKGISASENAVFMTPGAQMALYLMPLLFCDEGDVVLTEDFSYAHALAAVKEFNCRPVGVKTDDDGINLEALEHALKTEKRVKYLYLVPNFGNPSGITLSLEKRKAIYDLACTYDIMIFEDDAYGDLIYAGDPVPTIKSFDKEGRVVYVGTFSKTLSAGLRVGYMSCSKEIWDKAYAAKGNIDAGSNMTAQYIVSYYLDRYDFEAHINNVRKIYTAKWEKMRQCLDQYMHPACKRSDPNGGMFFWVTLPEYVDADAVFKAALEAQVGVVPSSTFAANPDNKGRAFRLCFSCSTLEQIEEGCKRFGEVTRKFCR